MHCIAHPEGEKATSRAAAATRIAMALSTYSTVSLEDVIAQRGQNPYALQLSILKDREPVKRWIKRAEGNYRFNELQPHLPPNSTPSNISIDAGYKALIITVDAPVLGGRLNERRNKFTLPEGMSFPNLEGPTYIDKDGNTKMEPVTTHHHNMRDATNSWESVIPWVKQNTKLEVWLKGSMLFTCLLIIS